MISNGKIIQPVTMTDVGIITGLSTRDLKLLIITAAYGGSNNGSYKQAFWTKEHNMLGTAAQGYLIEGTEPNFNVFSLDSPVVWVLAGGTLEARLKNTGNATGQPYSFSLGDFRNYNHTAEKCQLINPADFISYSTTKSIDIMYKMPYEFKLKLPEVGKDSYYILGGVPADFNGNIPFLAASKVTDNSSDFIFQTLLKGLPLYKGESVVLDWYVSVWDWAGSAGTLINLDPDNWIFRYKMPNIGKAYHATTTVTGGADKPVVVVTMNIEFVEPVVGYYDTAQYTRNTDGTIIVEIYNFELLTRAVLHCTDFGGPLDTSYVEAGYYSKFTKRYGFPNINYTNFAFKESRN